MSIIELRERLKTLAEPRFQAFASSLIPGVQNLLGVRLPLLRRLAIQIARTHRESIVYDKSEPQSMEETMVRGMLIGYAPAGVTVQTRLHELQQFVPLITNWSICDSCCATFKFAKENRNEVWSFLQPYLYSAAEFECRFAIVMILNHFIQEESWSRAFVQELPHTLCLGYYAEMAAAWCLCEIHARYPHLTTSLLTESSPLRADIRAKALRKIKESRKH